MRKSGDMETKDLLKISNRIKSIFARIRECLDDREKDLIENIESLMSKKKEVEFMDEMINDLIMIKEKYNKNTGDFDEAFSMNIDKNMANMATMIDDIKYLKKNKEKLDEYDFLYEESVVNDILNKIQNLGEIKKCSNYLFRWREGPNYDLSSYSLIATKTSGGEDYNCNILGDIVLPQNRISKWKVKLKKYGMSSNNDWDLLIGVGPSNLNPKDKDLYFRAWTFLCGNSKLSIQSGYYRDYIKENKKLKEGDVVEVTMNTMNGELSFAVNGVNYGVACKIPLSVDLSPFVLIYEPGDSVELIN